jgi:hypothetical protein
MVAMSEVWTLQKGTLMYSQRWPKRKLTKADGERILWHMLEHLQGIVHDLDGEPEAIQTIRALLNCELPENTNELVTSYADTHNIDIAYARACDGHCADCGASPEECFQAPCPYYSDTLTVRPATPRERYNP